MIQSLDNHSLTEYITAQINIFFPDKKIKTVLLYSFVKQAIGRVEYCFSKINNKYFFDGKNIFFNHLHSDQYAIFLYFLSNTIWMEERDDILAGKAYYLNKVLHGLDAFYEIILPDVFLLVHPVGTILGRAKYDDFFVVYQRVTVGGNTDLEYPIFGKGVALYGESAVIGNCRIGDGCSISYGTIVMEKDIQSNMVVFGSNSDITYKHASKSPIDRYFRNS